MKRNVFFPLLVFLLTFQVAFLQAQHSFIENVPYFNQNCNATAPGSTCQITCMAMVLKAYGAVNVTPDDINSRRGYTNAMSVSGWMSDFNAEAEHFGLSVRSTGYTTASVSELRQALAENKPVTVHGYFTGSGHLIVITGYNGSEYIANDPYGTWNEVYQGSYSNVYCGSEAGREVHYSADAVDAAIDIGGIWMHIPSESLAAQSSESDYCEARGTNVIGEWIGSFSIGEYENESGSNGGYADFTHENPVYLKQENSYAVTVSPEFSSQTYTEFWKIWIDFNQDGDFEDENELVFSRSGQTAIDGNITIPAEALTGETRMRVAMKGDEEPSPCEVFSYGEVEDYKVTILENNGGADYAVSISLPDEIFAQREVELNGTVYGDIQSVTIFLGNSEISAVEVVDGTYSFTYTFDETNNGKILKAKGFAGGNPVAETETTLTINEAMSAGEEWAYDFAENVLENSHDYENEAWNDISGGTPCVAFVSVGLRNHPTHNFPDVYCVVTDGPESEDCSLQLTCTLESLGYFDGPYYDLSELRKGDIVFTDKTVLFQGEYWSDHAMIFYEWSAGSSTHAKFLDYHNERGLPYERNVTGSGNYTKALFYYRYHSGEATGIAETIETERNTLRAYPTIVQNNMTVEAENMTGKTLSLYSLQGKLMAKTMITSDHFQYSLSGKPKGMYILRVEGFKPLKVIKQ